jgi:hypothetical protein
LVLGLHHLMWSLNRDYGKLELWRYNLPGIYIWTLITSVGSIYNAIHWPNSNWKSVQDLYHRRAVMDTLTVTTLISFLIFTVYNKLGITTSFEFEEKAWAAAMFGLPIVLVLGVVTQIAPWMCSLNDHLHIRIFKAVYFP